jgi:hypothetical protein
VELQLELVDSAIKFPKLWLTFMDPLSSHRLKGKTTETEEEIFDLMEDTSSKKLSILEDFGRYQAHFERPVNEWDCKMDKAFIIIKFYIAQLFWEFGSRIGSQERGTRQWKYFFYFLFLPSCRRLHEGT